jgi:DNA mismatch endonuclease (patch repair protein)
MQANRAESGPEQAMRRAPHARGARFRKHLAPVPGLRCRPDVVVPRRRLAVFVDGCFWHACPEHGRRPTANATWWAQKLQANGERDRRQDHALTAHGWQVLRLWEHEPAERMADEVLRAFADLSEAA